MSIRTDPASRTSSNGSRLRAGAVDSHTCLKLGASGDEVRQLQELLIDRGVLTGPASGQFDQATLSAVKSYQTSNGLKVDGIVGQQTWGSFDGQQLPPGVWMLKRPAGGYSGSSGFDGSGASSPSNLAPLTSNPAPSGSGVETMLNEARSHLGFNEGAGNNNPFSHAMGRPSEAWCADFVSFLARKAGLSLNTASAQGVADFLKSRGTWKGKSNPQPGDAVTFRWDGSGGWADHVGIVERVYVKDGQLWVDTIEGNSSDGVRRRSYPANSSKINGYGTIV